MRWTEFARLPYVDLVRYTIIDPMHNMLLGWYILCSMHEGLTAHCIGLVKTQWYHQWILRKPQTLRGDTTARERELNLIHKFLETVRLSVPHSLLIIILFSLKRHCGLEVFQPRSVNLQVEVYPQMSINVQQQVLGQ